MSKFLRPSLKVLRDAEADLLVARGRISTARGIVTGHDLTVANRFVTGSLRDAVVEADCLADQVAATLRRLEADLALERPSSRDQFISHVLDHVEIEYRPATQAVPYGSTYATFDASECDVLTRSVAVDVETDYDVPVQFTADYLIDAMTSVELRCRLRSITPQGRRIVATYAVCLESQCDDSAPGDCHPVLPSVIAQTA